MVNGIPGNMGRIVAETCIARGLELVPYSLTGEIIVENESVVAGRSRATAKNASAKCLRSTRTSFASTTRTRRP